MTKGDGIGPRRWHRRLAGVREQQAEQQVERKRCDERAESSIAAAHRAFSVVVFHPTLLGAG